MIPKTLETRLEKADNTDSVVSILDFKVNEIGPNRTVDYIGMALDNIDSSISRIDEAISELRAIKDGYKLQADIIKIGSAKWLVDNGLSKLDGDRISSISINEKKPVEDIVIDDEEAVINAGYFKMTIDKTAAKNALIDGVDVEGAHIEVTHNEPTIRINKKRK